MARLEDLVDEIEDPVLRDGIAREIARLKERKRFGLVYESHIPELVAVSARVRVGSKVTNRTKPYDHTQSRVIAIEEATALLRPDNGGAERRVAIDDLLVVKPFGEPVYPGLRPVGRLRQADEKSSHVVISGENFHALQALLVAHANRIDVIYLDPPYNTGDKSWKYNNRFVDENDGYRHSKWLSMMEKRLKLAGELLKPNGVLIVTIDEHEVHHLGVL